MKEEKKDFSELAFLETDKILEAIEFELGDNFIYLIKTFACLLNRKKKIKIVVYDNTTYLDKKDYQDLQVR